MSSKIQRFYTLTLLLLLSVGFFSGGYYFGKRGFEISYKKNPPQVSVINKDSGPKDVDFKEFWEVWDLITEKHIGRPFDPQKLMYGALVGLAGSVGDPYTSFLPPQENEAVTSSLNGEYSGIGAELGVKEDQIMVVAPLDGSPAISAGIKSGDRILKINSEPTKGMNINVAVSKIRGEKGTTVILNVQREALEAFDVPIVRDTIVIKSVYWNDKGDGIAYIRLSRFGDKTSQEWSEVVDDMVYKMPNLKSVILDLRGNPGGYLNGSVYIVSEFVSKGVVVKEQYADGSIQTLDVDRKGKLLKYPVIVLVDEGSASASEIVAMALKDYGRAKIVGAKSFGKGTIQDARDFEDGAGVHVTIAKWLSPKGTWVHGVGITPDVEVKITEEDIKNSKDTQLDKAIELAKESSD